MRRDEEFAREAFDRYLTLRDTPATGWEPQGKKCPDYYLLIQEQRYAVEITQLQEFEDLDGHKISTRGIEEALDGFRGEVEKQAKELGILRGVYLLALSPIPGLRQVRENIVIEALSYIEKTQNQSIVVRMPLIESRQQWSIQKEGDSASLVGMSLSIDDGKWGEEPQQDLSPLLAARVADKRRKLQDQKHPIILLLIDAYHYGECCHWDLSAREQDFSGFHTVARVYGEYRCQVLMSQEKEWWSAT